MGVKLSDLVLKQELAWDDLQNKVLAVDSSNMLFQFISSIRQRDGTLLMDSEGRVTSHLVGIASRIPSIMAKGIKPAFVFDGKAPKLKFQERERRNAIKEKAEKKYEKAKEEQDKEAMSKYAKVTTRLDKNMIDESKKLLKAFGLPIIQAPSEAEAQASYMCKKKKVWAVASSDYDCLLFKSPRMLINLTLAQKRKTSSGGTKNIYPQLIELNTTLKTLEIDHDQLLILAILVGTDFNPGGVKGIGPKKALKLIQSDQNFETIFEELNPDFDWKKIQDVFKNMPITDEYDMSFNEPDEDKIKEILIEEHNFSKERVEKTLSKMGDKPKKDKSQTGLNQWLS